MFEQTWYVDDSVAYLKVVKSHRFGERQFLKGRNNAPPPSESVNLHQPGSSHCII